MSIKLPRFSSTSFSDFLRLRKLWTSSNPKIAKVGEHSGLVTGVAAGKVAITARSGDLSETMTLTVEQIRLEISPDTNTITEGNKLQFTAVVRDANGLELPTGPRLMWSSSNPRIATVDEHSGLVTGVIVGPEVIITARSGDKTDTVTLEVIHGPPTSLDVSSETDTKIIIEGETLKLTALVRDASGHELSLSPRPMWSSSNSEIAKVDEHSGLVTGVMGGPEVTITAELGDLSETMTLTVSHGPPARLDVSSDTDTKTIIEGKTLKLTALVRDDKEHVLGSEEVVWSSSNPEIATVDESSGLVTSVAAGTEVTITAELGDLTDSVTLSVNPADTGKKEDVDDDENEGGGGKDE